MTAPNRSAAYAALPWPVFRERWAQLPSRAQRDEALRLRFREDQAGFLRYLWPDTYTRPWAAPHVEMLSRPKVPWRDRRGSQTRTYRAIAAPRGISKTGIIRGSIVHDICYGLERVIPILSAGLDLSIASLAAIRAMLMEPKVAQLYGPMSIVGGATRYTVTVGSHRCTLIAKSFGTSVRGLNDEGVRPTRLIVDDGEDKLKVNNPDQRRKWWDFLVADLQKIGDLAGGLIIDWVGTVLHTDSVLARLLTNGGWQASRYAALQSWPDRPDLWEACGRVWADLTIGDVHAREEAARAFYDEHHEEMDRGAVMLHSQWIDLFAFYVAIWTEGIGSVLKELQNTPRDPTACVYDSATFPKCRVVTLAGGELGVQRLRPNGEPDGKPVPRSELRVSLRLDPIPGDEMGALGGGAGGSDFAAIAVIARDSHGWAYVVDGWMRRAKDSAQMAAFWTLAEKWKAEEGRVESNGFQRWMTAGFKRQQEERREVRKWWRTALKDAKDSVSTTNKDNDIAAMEPVIASRLIYFAENLPADAQAQWDDWPGGAHDDWPDAVSRGYRDSDTVIVGMVNHPLGAPATPFRR